VQESNENKGFVFGYKGIKKQNQKNQEAQKKDESRGTLEKNQE
jgi:hypothetical protein